MVAVSHLHCKAESYALAELSYYTQMPATGATQACLLVICDGLVCSRWFLCRSQQHPPCQWETQEPTVALASPSFSGNRRCNLPVSLVFVVKWVTCNMTLSSCMNHMGCADSLAAHTNVRFSSFQLCGQASIAASGCMQLGMFMSAVSAAAIGINRRSIESNAMRNCAPKSYRVTWHWNRMNSSLIPAKFVRSF